MENTLFAPPTPEPTVASAQARGQFVDVSSKELKSIYSNLRTIRGLGLLFGLLACLCLLFLFVPIDITFFEKIVSAVIVGICIPTSIGLYSRQVWGRWLGLVACIPFCFGLIGIIGVFVLMRSGELFSNKAIRLKDVKSELAYRRKNKIK